MTCLNLITARTNPLLVVSSSWRTRGDCRGGLREIGVVADFHEDWATDTEGPHRGAEIERWLASHGRPPYVVVDDWPDGLQEHQAHLVQTDFRIGLQSHDIDAAVRILAADGDEAQ